MNRKASAARQQRVVNEAQQELAARCDACRRPLPANAIAKDDKRFCSFDHLLDWQERQEIDQQRRASV